jgi:polyhydroxyalkanoate synthesis regulator phasin
MIGCKQGSRGIILAVTKMALTREDIQALLRILDEDPQLLQELRRRILPDHFVFEVRFPTEWMAQFDRRLANLERDVGGLKSDVGGLKGDVGELRSDVGGLKSDVGGLKSDVGVLKSDVGELKGDVGVLKGDVGGLKSDVGVLKSDVDGLKRDVNDLKNDVGRLKGMSKEISFRQKAGAYLGVLLRGGRDASELVNKILDEAEAEGLITLQEADYVRAADLLWVGTVKRGKFAGQKLIIVAEISWVADEEDVERAIERAQILRKAKAWAVPFVVGEEWVSQEVKEKALQRFVFCAENGRIEPERSDWGNVERVLEVWHP